jgi:hypothetical protein
VGRRRGCRGPARLRDRRAERVGAGAVEQPGVEVAVFAGPEPRLERFCQDWVQPGRDPTRVRPERAVYVKSTVIERVETSTTSFGVAQGPPVA